MAEAAVVGQRRPHQAPVERIEPARFQAAASDAACPDNVFVFYSGDEGIFVIGFAAGVERIARLPQGVVSDVADRLQNAG